ncbi:hypothetical protein APHAL10511_005163 [Amanita phalloides]|nr:hypothetical protein APHAL10511_005163 [Amanita phalloides]
MFGEADSESPRVPSPWDALISASPVPRLVPENDSGNVEYKLQLISPSAARFARLVTQLKWRLLEGGGQAYYELGVADSGVLVGLGKTEMEASLETLEMMAGEIGASVVVVKEVVVPEAMVLAVQAQQAAGMLLGEDKDKWMRTRKRGRRKGGGGCADGDDTSTTTTTTTTTTDITAAETTDVEGEEEDLSATVLLYRSTHSSHHNNSVLPPGFTMDPDPDPDPAEVADGEQEEPEPELIPNIVIDIEISAVFKPRPMRTRIHSAHPMNQTARNKRQKKQCKPVPQAKETQPHAEGGKSRRHRRRDRKRTASLQPPPMCANANGNSDSPSPSPFAVSMEPPTVALTMTEEADALVSNLEALHVSVEMGDDMLMLMVPPPTPAPTPASTQAAPVLVQEPKPEPFVVVEKEDHLEDDIAEDDDVFPTPSIPPMTANFDSGRAGEPIDDRREKDEPDIRRVIVEALVVRKMSLQEAFLDFGAFS